jgi:hypothetical protein
MDPDAALEILRSAIRAWQEAVVAGSADAVHDAAADAITAAKDLDYWLSRGGYLPAAWSPPPPGPSDTHTDATYAAEAAHAAYADAASRFARAIQAKVTRRIHADFPTAVYADVVGEYGEDYELRLRLVAVRGPVAVLADDSDGELWDALTNEVDPDLDWLAQLEPDDWTGSQQLDLSHPSSPPPSLPDRRTPEGDRS